MDNALAVDAPAASSATNPTTSAGPARSAGRSTSTDPAASAASSPSAAPSTSAGPSSAPAAAQYRALPTASDPAGCTSCAGRPGEGFATLAMLVTMVAVGLGLALFTQVEDGFRFLLMLAAGVTAAILTTVTFRRRAHPGATGRP